MIHLYYITLALHFSSYLSSLHQFVIKTQSNIVQEDKKKVNYEINPNLVRPLSA